MRKPVLTAAVTGAVAAVLCGALATAALASSGGETKPRAVAARVGGSNLVAQTKVAARTKSGLSPENKQLLRIQNEIKATTAGPTAAQVAEADRLVKQLKADGRATKAQLAWLALSPTQKRVQVAPVGTN